MAIPKASTFRRTIRSLVDPCLKSGRSGCATPGEFTLDDPQRGGSGALLIADVGENAVEEINYEPAGRGGRNYGWRNREGSQSATTLAAAAFEPLTDPIFEYDHGVGRSITGGYVYRGYRHPVDDRSLRLWRLHPRTHLVDRIGARSSHRRGARLTTCASTRRRSTRVPGFG